MRGSLARRRSVTGWDPLAILPALVLARVRTVVFGAREPKTGALVSTTQPLEIPTLNHRFEVVEGVLER